MLKTRLYARTGATAIAAVLALSSTSVFAQEIDTATEVTTSAEPAPVSAEPVTPTAVEATPVAEPAPTASAKKPAPVKRSVTTAKSAAPARAVESIATAKVTPTPTETDAVGSAPVAAAPVAPTIIDEPVKQPVVQSDDATQLAFGGGLAAVALGGLALFASRRRKRTSEMSDEAVVTDVARPVMRRDHPVISTADERSAFAWGNKAPAHAPANAVRSGDPVAMAHAGPTPDNPSQSLKKRLKRAAFFEQRERAAANGHAVPVSRFAGLPQRAVEAVKQASVSRPLHYHPV